MSLNVGCIANFVDSVEILHSEHFYLCLNCLLNSHFMCAIKVK